MLRRHNGQGWIEHPWETVDPDEVSDSLKILNTGSSGTWFDACWPLLVQIDPEAMLRARTQQKAYLARYGRQSWYAWEDREVADLEEAFSAIAEIVADENTGGVEDR